MGMRMLNFDEFRKRLEARGLSRKNIDFSVDVVDEFEGYLKKNGKSIASMGLSDLKKYVSLLIKQKRNSHKRLVALARCLAFVKKNDEFMYLLGTFGASNVLPDIGDRLTSIAGKEVRRKVFEGFELPPLGTSHNTYPALTEMIVKRMEAELPNKTCREVLTWNYHKVPAAAFKDAKERFEKAASIDEYLEGEHKELLKELEACMKEDRLWYEQKITPEVLEFVKANQEICTGVRKGDKIYETKIPFAPPEFLAETDPVMKRYYACHCLLVRASLKEGKSKVPSTFCYCSAGYHKARFDAVFGESVEIELLESVLKGDDRCRFATKIPKGKMK